MPRGGGRREALLRRSHRHLAPGAAPERAGEASPPPRPSWSVAVATKPGARSPPPPHELPRRRPHGEPLDLPDMPPYPILYRSAAALRRAAFVHRRASRSGRQQQPQHLSASVPHPAPRAVDHLRARSMNKSCSPMSPLRFSFLRLGEIRCRLVAIVVRTPADPLFSADGAQQTVRRRRRFFRKNPAVFPA